MAEAKVTLAQIQAAIAETGAEWQAGVTSVSELTQEEQQLLLGVEPPPGGFESVLRAAAGAKALVAEGGAGLPAAYDLRNVGGKNFITPIKNQGSCGSCVAFGTIAAIEGQFRFQRQDPGLVVDLSEAHLFFCLGKAQGVTCNTGWMPDKAFACVTNTGVVDEDCYRYDTNQTGCTSANLCSDWQSRTLKITGFSGVSAGQIKTLLNTKGPVSACFVVYNDFFNYRSGVYRHVSGAQAGGHCVCIIGYDDAAGCWICKNSWGTGWGESGFFRIAYGECGIDTWANHAATAIAETMWLNGRKVMGLWTIDQDRNAWAYLDGGVGWRRVAYDNDNIFMDVLTPLIAAKAANRPINVWEEAGVLKQLYVL